MAKQREYTLKELAVWTLVLGLLVLYAGPIRDRSERIETASGYLGPCYTEYRRRRGIDLYVTVDGCEYMLDGDYIEQPVGILEEELGKVITYNAEVVYMTSPTLKPHLLGLTVGQVEYVSFDEVYAEWQENNRAGWMLCAACFAGGALMLAVDGWKKKKKTEQSE